MARRRILANLLVVTALSLNCRAMVMRNNALINKMVSHFQKDNYASVEHNSDNRQNAVREIGETTQRPEKVLSLMQNVLCRNFPTIPCKYIIEDETLRNLIQKSIQQIKYKTIAVEKTTGYPGFLTLFPAANSEDLSNMIQARNNRAHLGKNKKHDAETSIKKKKHNKDVSNWSQEKTRTRNGKSKKDPKRSAPFNSRKKMRKFYPHKVKYKDKNTNTARAQFGDYTEEKLSMSVEVPDMTLTKHHQHLNYKAVPADPPVWRIDYLKHGEPSLNMLGYAENGLKGKTGPSVIVDENVLEQTARNNVLHPDVYIKKNYVKKTNTDLTSENTE